MGLQHSHHQIINNIIENSQLCGLELVVTDQSTIEYNTFIQNPLAINLEYSKGNIIQHNNFIYNEYNAIFNTALFTKWICNYYSNHEIGSPYFIYGTLFEIKLPWFNIDWHPAQEPYDI